MATVVMLGAFVAFVAVANVWFFKYTKKANEKFYGRKDA